MVSRAAFLPINQNDLKRRHWKTVDVLIISADAYVDHPSFAPALLGRLLEARGYKVAIIAQPRPDTVEDFLAVGKPNLCCMIAAGALDSMVSRYTANKKVRNDDPYSPGGKASQRPNRVLATYCSRARQAFGSDTPIIIGGLEASLRKFSHYDYWSDRVRRSILLDSKADLLVYGMGELQTLEILERLKSDLPLNHIAGTLENLSQVEYETRKAAQQHAIVELPSYDEVALRNPKSNQPLDAGQHAYAKAFQLQMLHENPFDHTILVQASQDRYLWRNQAAMPIDQNLFDEIHEFPYTRAWHPDYEAAGGVPALHEVQFSLTSNRGCFGSCSFCAITMHQGRLITTRSLDSLLREAKVLTQHKDFKGYIHDVGGPTANFQGPACQKQLSVGPCPTKECLFPEPCSQLLDYHAEYRQKLTAIAQLPKVKKVFVRSGIRYDYLLNVASEKERTRFIDQLAKHHVSGQLRIAPEHVGSETLNAMGKPSIELYDEFTTRFSHANKKMGLKQYCIPYFITAHPGTTLEEAIELSLYLKKSGFIPEQVQEFYPTPGTVATCMYYTGLDPRPNSGFATVHVPKGRERTLQRALIHFHKKEHYRAVLEALTITKRLDLKNLLLGHRRRKK